MLGGGNHFIEVCLDEANPVWVMLHSGSGGIGNAIVDYFIQLPDRDLAYLAEGSEHFSDYVEPVDWAKEYALVNRQAMLDLVLNAVARHLPQGQRRDRRDSGGVQGHR